MKRAAASDFSKATFMNPILQTNHLSKHYRRSVAVDNLTLEIPAGVVFALLGENGAGKSTTLRMLMGLERPTAGSAQVLGFDCESQGVQIRRQCGYLPEQPVLYDWMTVAEIGWFTAGFYDDSFLPRFHRLVGEYELPLARKLSALSKGGRAKVGLALAMAHEPQLLVLDEPTSGLDTLVRRQFLESIVEMAATGRTVLLSSHQIGEVERVADSVAILNKGRLLACDTLDNLKAQYERWIITFGSHEHSLPDFSARILSHEGIGTRRQQMFVERPGPESLWKLRDHPGIVEVEVHTPSLEELFVALIQPAGSPPEDATTRPFH